MMAENRNGLIVDAMVTSADGTAEADAALLMAVRLRKKHRCGRITLGADKAYDPKKLIQTLRELGVATHASQNNKRRRSALDRRTTRHSGNAMSQRRRPLIEKVFGWMKPIAGLKKVKLRGLRKVGWLLQFASAAYSLLRIPKLRVAAA